MLEVSTLVYILVQIKLFMFVTEVVNEVSVEELSIS